MYQVLELQKPSRQITELLKYIGFGLMLVDHIFYLYFPELIWGRIIGRLSAPIFFYLLAINSDRSSNNYLKRLIGFGCFALIVMKLLGLNEANILISLAYCLCYLKILKKIDKKILYIPITIIFGVVASLLQLDYGWYSISSVLLFKVFRNTKSWWFLWIINNIFSIFIGIVQPFAVFAPLLITFIVYQKSKIINSIPFKPLGFAWYPLYILQWIILKIPFYINI